MDLYLDNCTENDSMKRPVANGVRLKGIEASESEQREPKATT